ncbi:hypothetical protein KI387_014265 [Taxus chinensis]|uniref:RRM domain-containing protein n=1 Tax=Taxus chinensis TaxID=29808 RepID=A0AA38FI13_TAXCH|nr:hypothetical protein KI387_014265 [Taxus chinensis]
MALMPNTIPGCGCGVDKLFKRNIAVFTSWSLNRPTSCSSSSSLSSSLLFGIRVHSRPLCWPVACLSATGGSRKLFVTGLSFYTSVKSLENAFSSYGKIVDVTIIMDRVTKRSKGYGFVEYSTEAEANEALKEMNGKILNGRAIIVDLAKPVSQVGRSRAVPEDTSDMNRELTTEAVEDSRSL